jgi:hypothetical protein
LAALVIGKVWWAEVMMRAVRTRRRWSAVTVLVLVAGLVQVFVPPPMPAAAGPKRPPAPAREPLGKATAVKPVAPPADSHKDDQVTGVPVVTWPTSGTTQVSPAAGLTADARPGGVSPGAVRAGALPIWVGPAKSGRTIGGNVSIHVADRPATQRAGVSGLLLSVGSADPVTLAVDYSGFRNAYGGDWATRLRLETLPACALTTPVRSDCQRGTPLATTNNTTAHILSANVPANAVVAADAGAAGARGPYQANTRSTSGAR